MTFDPTMLDILICPQSKGDLEVVELPQALRERLVERFREHFADEEPQVEQGLLSRRAELVYPIVSGMPILLVDEAVPASELEA